jgi:peptidoglycan-associated lipoprotein
MISPIPPIDDPSRLDSDTIDASTIPEERLPLDKVQPPVVVEELPVIYFDFDKFDLKASEMEKLDNIVAPWIKSQPTAHIQIEGHCDERGTEEYNLNLGQKRASAVRDYLIEKDCNAKTLHTISYGEERPVALEQTEEAYSMNRRVQFLVFFTEE